MLYLLRPWGSRSSLLSIIITDRPSYMVVDCRRPSFSGHRCSCLERTTTVAASSLAVVWRLDISAVHFQTFCKVPVKRLVSLSDTLIAFVTYLITSTWRRLQLYR